MHIIGIRKFSCIYQIVKEVDFFQLKRSYNLFNETRQYHVNELNELEPNLAATMRTRAVDF